MDQIIVNDAVANNADVMAANIDLDDLEFKALSDGLGFHQENQTPEVFMKTKKPYQSLAKKELGHKPLPMSKEVETKPVVKTATLPQPLMPSVPSVPLSSELTESMAEAKKEVKKNEKKASPIVMASVAQRVGAFLIDFMSIIAGVAILLAGFALVLNKVLGAPYSYSFSYEFINYYAILFVLMSFFYFAIMESSSTFGKKIFSISVKKVDGSRLTLFNSVGRVVLTFLSFFAMGLPLILDFPSKLSDTVVVQE
jgi:uncharacterized RDD family membrane protein YckC